MLHLLVLWPTSSWVLNVSGLSPFSQLGISDLFHRYLTESWVIIGHIGPVFSSSCSFLVLMGVCLGALSCVRSHDRDWGLWHWTVTLQNVLIIFWFHCNLHSFKGPMQLPFFHWSIIISLCCLQRYQKSEWGTLVHLNRLDNWLLKIEDTLRH